MQTRPSEKSEPMGRARNSEVFLKGTSPGTRAVEELIRELSLSDVPVLLLAETGAGKQTVARRIHEASRRSNREFRLIDCRGVGPENFDGIDGGILACQGTVYLDEIASLSSGAQARLLEALIRLEEEGNEKQSGRLICGSEIWKRKRVPASSMRIFITGSAGCACDFLPCGTASRTSRHLRICFF